jgi:ribose 5-phosphate isomerase A
MSAEQLKREAARQALTYVRSGMRLGLGTGSTVAHLLDLLGSALREGGLEDIVGVPTSERTADAATDLGIPIATLAELPALDLTIDGADEVDPGLDLIKGLGGALLREKMVAQASRSLVIMVDDSKLVSRLGEKAPLPVEVVGFGWESHVDFLRSLGGEPILREDGDGSPYVTDNGNYILDAHFTGGMEDPRAVSRACSDRAGIVETGLFLGMADAITVASPGGTRVMERS